MLSLLGPLIQAQSLKPSGVYSLDSSNTQIEFSAKHFGVLKVEGNFKKFSGKIVLEQGRITSGTLTIMVSSISTDNNARDRSLMSDDFLSVETYPTIKLNIVEGASHLDKAQVLTQIKGMKNIIVLDYSIQEYDGAFQLIVFCSISREDFNLDFGTMDDLVSDEIQVRATLAFS